MQKLWKFPFVFKGIIKQEITHGKNVLPKAYEVH